MKVLVLTNLYPNKNDSNWGIFNFQQFSHLSKQCELIFVVPISWVLLLRWGKKGKGNLALDGQTNVYHPTYYYTPKIFRCLYGLFYFLSSLPQAYSLIKREEPNVILGTWAYPDGFSAVLLGKLFNLPVYIKVHGTDIHSVKGICARKMTSWTLNSCKKVISVSSSLSNIMKNEFGVQADKISVIPNGINKSMFYKIDRDDAIKKLSIDRTHERNILFVGHLRPGKNVALLIEAFAKLVANNTADVALHIVGTGAIFDELKEYINTNSLQEHVFMHGGVPHALIPIWLNYTDVLVLPSMNEGMPNVVLEALSCGTPVVASDIEATREIIDVGINGYLFDLQNLDDFVNKLKLGLSLKQAPEFDHKHDMIITWQENAARLHQIIA